MKRPPYYIEAWWPQLLVANCQWDIRTSSFEHIAVQNTANIYFYVWFLLRRLILLMIPSELIEGTHFNIGAGVLDGIFDETWSIGKSS